MQNVDAIGDITKRNQWSGAEEHGKRPASPGRHHDQQHPRWGDQAIKAHRVWGMGGGEYSQWDRRQGEDR
jgi:hypothetical protein